ncbi:hypothetical protein ACFV8T_40790 [Streptomyces sp. NPDC059832]|uniref:hypothetical protein n=1 Tax=unclassified Streptomyces TaxID=2593676 RepID=UPI003657E372
MTVLDPRSGVEVPGRSPSARYTADGSGIARTSSRSAPVEAPLFHYRFARHRILGYGLVACGLALLPWLYLLATGVLATEWSTAWVGLDLLEAAALIGTGLLTVRQNPWAVLAAAATAPLLLTDAWFDVMTTRHGSDLAVALGMAVAAELPLAACCAVMAVRGLRIRRCCH